MGILRFRENLFQDYVDTSYVMEETWERKSDGKIVNVLRNESFSKFFLPHTFSSMHDDPAPVRAHPAPFKVIDHTTASIKWRNGQVTLRYTRSQGIYNKYLVITYASPAALYRHRFGMGPTTWAYLLNGAPTSNSAGEHYATDWYALADQLQEKLEQIIPQGMQLGETLIEHEIFVDLFKMLINPTNALRNILKYSKLIGNTPLARLRQMAKRLAGTYLGYQFGVKPALDDVRKIVDASYEIQKRLYYLRANQGKFIPVRARLQQASPTTDPPEFVFNPGVSSKVRKIFSERTTIGSMSCWARVREDLNLTDNWNAATQYFGLNKVLGLAWELVPFSFVVDWFTNVQERINTFTRIRTKPPFTEVNRMGYSQAETTLYDVQFLNGFNPSLSGWIPVGNQKPFTLCTVRKRRYIRSLQQPGENKLFDFSNLGFYQFVTGAALFIQRLR